MVRRGEPKRSTWQRGWKEGVSNTRFNPLGPHSWGRKRGNWGTPPNPRQDFALHPNYAYVCALVSLRAILAAARRRGNLQSLSWAGAINRAPLRTLSDSWQEKPLHLFSHSRGGGNPGVATGIAFQPSGPHSWGKMRRIGDTPNPGSILLHHHSVQPGQPPPHSWGRREWDRGTPSGRPGSGGPGRLHLSERELCWFGRGKKSTASSARNRIGC